MKSEFDKATEALDIMDFNINDILIYQDKRFRAIGELVRAPLFTTFMDAYAIKNIIIIRDKHPNLINYLQDDIVLSERIIKQYLSKPTQSDLDYKIIEDIK